MYVCVHACVDRKDFSIENKVTKCIKIITLLGEFYYLLSKSHETCNNFKQILWFYI